MVCSLLFIHRDSEQESPTHILGQQITIRDALSTALTLDTFNRNAEKVSLQLIDALGTIRRAIAFEIHQLNHGWYLR